MDNTLLSSLAEAAQTLASQDPVALAIPVFIVFLLIELWVDFREQRHLHKQPDSWASIGMGLGSVGVNLFSKSIYFLIFMYLHKHFTLFAIEPSLLTWLLLFVLDDFTFYWHHRLSHQIGVLWAAHSNHHSSEYYNFSTALRQSWTEFLYKYVFWTPLVLIGFPPLMIFTMISLSLIYQFFLHTATVRKLGLLEHVFNTPSHHRVHHAINLRYLDKNHAGILIVWDKLFGTFEPESEQDNPVYGLTVNIRTYHPVRIAFAEYKALYQKIRTAPNLLIAVRYLLKPPGWSHNGSSKTTRQLRDSAQI